MWLCEGSTLHHRVLRSLFPRPDVATVSHFAIFVDVDVQLQDSQTAARGKRTTAVICDISGVDHRGLLNLQLSAPIWFTGQRHCTVFHHVMQFSLLVLCWKSTLTVFYPRSRKRDPFQMLATGVRKLKTWLGSQRVKVSICTKTDMSVFGGGINLAAMPNTYCCWDIQVWDQVTLLCNTLLAFVCFLYLSFQSNGAALYQTIDDKKKAVRRNVNSLFWKKKTLFSSSLVPVAGRNFSFFSTHLFLCSQCDCPF